MGGGQGHDRVFFGGIMDMGEVEDLEKVWLVGRGRGS